MHLDQCLVPSGAVIRGLSREQVIIEHQAAGPVQSVHVRNHRQAQGLQGLNDALVECHLTAPFRCTLTSSQAWRFSTSLTEITS